MTIWQLQVLAAVIESGSLQAASAQLHRTPSALSMALNKLEQELNVQILDRSGYRLALTERGKQFMRHSHELLRQHERLQSLGRQLQSGAEAQLEVAFEHTCSIELLMPALRAVQQQYPSTELLLSGYSQLNSLTQVQEKKSALAVTPWLPVFQQRADFETLYLQRFELVVVMARGMIGEYGQPHTREALGDLPYILPRQMDMGINPEQIYRVGGQSRMRVNDVQTLLMMVRAGMGWSIVPRQLVADDLAGGDLVHLDIPGFMDRLMAEVHLVKLAGTVLGPAGEALWQYFEDRDRENRVSN
jgi:DNA-binding transcriptional LysR family regulator